MSLLTLSMTAKRLLLLEQIYENSDFRGVPKSDILELGLELVLKQTTEPKTEAEKSKLPLWTDWENIKDWYQKTPMKYSYYKEIDSKLMGMVFNAHNEKYRKDEWLNE